jgi:hypothetical protein
LSGLGLEARGLTLSPVIHPGGRRLTSFNCGDSVQNAHLFVQDGLLLSLCLFDFLVELLGCFQPQVTLVEQLKGFLTLKEILEAALRHRPEASPVTEQVQ